MKPDLEDFKTRRGRVIYKLVTELQSNLEYPKCEGKDDMSRIIAHWEKILKAYDYL